MSSFNYRMIKQASFHDYARAATVRPDVSCEDIILIRVLDTNAVRALSALRIFKFLVCERQSGNAKLSVGHVTLTYNA